MNQKLLKYLSYGALALVIVSMMFATVLERLQGTPEAFRLVYHNPVFFALWAISALSGILYLLQLRSWKNGFTFTLHVSLLLILAGALVTFLTGESGTLHVREGETAQSYIREDDTSSPLPFSIRLEEFAVEYYPDSRMPSDYRSAVTFLPEGKEVLISMNRIGKYQGYRFYQADYDEDGQGSILAVSHDPWGVGITYAGYLLLLLSMLGFFFQKNTAFRAACTRIRLPKYLKTGLIIAACLLLLGCFWLICRKWIFRPLVPVLRSPLLWIHVFSMILSYTGFALMALNGIVGLAHPSADTRERLKDVSLAVLYPAEFLLVFGTFLGAVWANISWGNYWAWDPKETWALITLLVYAFPLHGASLKLFRNPRFFHAYALFAFLCVLVTYFGVNLLLGGIHSYA